jgi:hypothetical protein
MPVTYMRFTELRDKEAEQLGISVSSSVSLLHATDITILLILSPGISI